MTSEVRRYIIGDVAKLKKAWAFIKAGDEPIGFDVETSGPSIKWRGDKSKPDAYRHTVTGFSLSRGNFAVYIPVRHRVDLMDMVGQSNVPLLIAKAIWSELFELAAAGRRVWVHNLAYELNIMINEGVITEHTQPPAGMLDSMVAVWLAYTKRGKDVALKSAAGWLLGLKDLPSFNSIANGRQTEDVLPSEIGDYAAMDAWLTVAVGETSYARLEEHELTDHFHSLDMPLVEITRGMARAGMARDRTELERLREIWVGRRDAARAAFEKLTLTTIEIPTKVRRPTGEYFKNGKPRFRNVVEMTTVTLGADISKDAQVSRWMYDNLKWWPIPERWDRRKSEYVGIDRNDKGVFSVKAEYVRKFTGLAGDAGTAAKLRMEYQKYSKLIGTYLEVLINLPDQYGDDRIHPSLNVTGTTTQRFSGSGPNFQNIPSRDITGTEIRRTLSAPIPGWVMVVRDYSQVELRLQADIAKDGPWMKGYQMEADFGLPFDLHQQAADELTKLLKMEVKRSTGKVVNLSVQYGVSAETLTVHIATPGIDRVMSQAIIDAFYEVHPRFLVYQDKAEKFAIRNGYIPTKDGYKRFGLVKKWLPREQRMGLSPHDRRVAANTPIQGWSAGIMKASMIDLWRLWTSQGIYGNKVLLLNSVHDEIVVGVQPDMAEQIGRDMDAIMTKPRWGIKVNLTVDGKTGATWAEAK